MKDMPSYGTPVRLTDSATGLLAGLVGKVIGAAYTPDTPSACVDWPIAGSNAKWHPIAELEVVPDSFVPDRSDEDTESRAAADPDDDDGDGPWNYGVDATHDFYDPMGEDR